MKKGESLVLCDGKGTEAEAVIREAFPESVVLDITERRNSIAEPETEVVLYQALPKFDKLEYIIQKSVELGVSKIVPVMTSRCISRPDEKTMKKKLERLRKIADEAAKQSGRGKLHRCGMLGIHHPGRGHGHSQHRRHAAGRRGERLRQEPSD